MRGFLDAVKLKDDWITGMQKKAVILELRHSAHIESKALTLGQTTLLMQSVLREVFEYSHA